MKGFEVGGKVVCIKSHSRGIVREGEVFTILGISECKCMLVLDVGVSYRTKTGKTRCSVCNTSHEGPFIGSILFVPIDDFKQITFTKIIENVPTGVN